MLVFKQQRFSSPLSRIVQLSISADLIQSTMLFSFVYAATAFALSLIPTAAGLPQPNTCVGMSASAPLSSPELPGSRPLLTHYDQLGGLCPDKWLENNTYTPGNGTYRYPLYDGFQRSTANMSIEGEELLLIGTRLDRFGDAGGKYLSPAYTPVEQRSLPPKRLNPTGFPATVEYHVYEVIVPILVRAGTIAAAFGQPGQGTQYELVNATVATAAFYRLVLEMGRSIVSTNHIL
ncbi:hypothetical protein B0H14DRAFT_3881984 [Mycena olivaceomarginata]|nr:hypothetical protein B0H14DRAFT_3881984 [Mycena olivaceomarginata]